MKRLFTNCLAVIALLTGTFSCKKNTTVTKLPPNSHNLSLSTPGDSGGCYERTATATLSGTISSDLTLTPSTLYLLDGVVFVTNGATLTIPAGTRIEALVNPSADSPAAIVVVKGSKIQSLGTAACPVVFTSHDAIPAPGNWGGIVLLGDAPVNKSYAQFTGFPFGGSNSSDNSGTIQFTLIEYAGWSLGSNAHGMAGLTLLGIGNQTTISYVEAYYSATDAYYIAGGTVNPHHLVAMAPDDDAFDITYGFTGAITYSLSILDPNKSSYAIDPNGIESDNDDSGTADIPFTRPVFDHVTIIGMPDSAAAVANPLLNAARFRRGSLLSVTNSVFMGYPTGIRFESNPTNANVVNFNHNVVQYYVTPYALALPYTIPANNNTLPTSASDGNAYMQLTSPFDAAAFMPDASSPAFNGGYFGTYQGAFDPNNPNQWTDYWTNLYFYY